MNTLQQGNITRVEEIDLSKGDYEREQGFFVRATNGATLTYIPLKNVDSETLTKTWDASVIFNDPELIRRVISVIPDGEQELPTNIFAGFGL